MALYPLLRPLIFLLEAEEAHEWALAALSRLPASDSPRRFDPALASDVAGLRFPSPVGLAAGLDKDARAAAQFMALGFGFVEVGTLTPLPQAGNAKPRLFRLEADRAIINRMGFNNGGQAAALDRIAKLPAPGQRAAPLGINIGANKDSVDRIADYAAGARAMAPLADYLTVNISSPNTPGLRALQEAQALADLLAGVTEALAGATHRPPVFLKVAPDLALADIDAIARVVLDQKVAALIVSNTTISRPALGSPHAGEQGGLSGAPLAVLARERLADFRTATGGTVPLISAGGIADADEAMARIRAGASLVQVYSALIYQGPGLARRIARDVALMLKVQGLSSIAQAIGTDAR